MEAFARVFSSSSAARFPLDLAKELKAAGLLVWEEALYASYIRKDASAYMHNPSRASIAITGEGRLVVVAAGRKQIDLPLNEPLFRSGLQIWTEKKERRIHFKLEPSYYGTGIDGSLFEVRAETPNAGRIMVVINSILSSGARTIPMLRPAVLSAGRSQPVYFPKPLRDDILANSPIIFEEGLPGSTVVRKEGRENVQSATPVSIAITKNGRLVAVPHGQHYCDFPLNVKWCRDALRVWLDQDDDLLGLEIQTGPFRPSHRDEVTEIWMRTSSAAHIKSLIDSTATVQELDARAVHPAAIAPELEAGAVYLAATVRELEAGPPYLKNMQELEA